MISLEINVFGVVQGVGFRYYTKLLADELSLKGWVKNLPDGSVLIQVGGPDQPVLDFLQWCHKGPRSSKVDRLEYKPINKLSDDTFTIIR